MQILKSYANHGRKAPIWFYRDKEKREVDLLIDEDGLLHPVEIKLTASPIARDLAGIRALARTGAKSGHGAVICMAKSAFPLGGEIDAVPVGLVN